VGFILTSKITHGFQLKRLNRYMRESRSKLATTSMPTRISMIQDSSIFNDHHNSCSFETLKRLDERIGVLTDRSSDYMGSFWNSDLGCFVIDHSVQATRPSIVSSCLGLHAILASPQNWCKGGCTWEDTSVPDSTISIKRALKTLNETVWRGDGFSTPVLVSTFSKYFPSSELRNNQKFITALDKVLNQRARIALHHEQR